MTIENLAKKMKQDIYENGVKSPAVRKDLLTKLKVVISNNEKSIGEALKKDLGKSEFETYTTEIGFILEELSFTLKNMDEWSKVKKVKTPLSLFPAKSYIRPEPYGVVLLISPWNYPFQLCMSPLIGAIAAGNKVVLKPSEFAPETSKIISYIISNVFNSDDVVVVDGGVEETQTLLKQNFDYIFFTGSTQVGKIIMKAAAENLTPVTLELGGKSPCFIHESANLDIAAKRIVWGKFLNSGQTCVAPDYVLIPTKLQDAFIEKVKNYIHTFYGEEIKSSNDYPRIVNEKHFNRLLALIDKSKIAVGGDHSIEEKFITPTILKNVSWEDEVMKDEIFGPILPVIPYEDSQKAINGILGYSKPLAFYLFAEDSQFQDEITSKISFGGGCINDTVVHLANPSLPFGGVGSSGIGSYHGKKSFDTFTHYKSILKQGSLVDIPFRYPPYNENKLSWIKFFLR